MWKEVVTHEDFKKVDSLNKNFGCSIGREMITLEEMKEKLPDCHFYYYESENIELFIGNRYKKENKTEDEYIHVLVYAIKADIKDYPEAFRILALKGKEYLEGRKEKKYVIAFGSEDKTQVNLYNKCVTPIGLDEGVRLAKIEYEKVGFKLSYEPNKIIVELV